MFIVFFKLRLWVLIMWLLFSFFFLKSFSIKIFCCALARSYQNRSGVIFTSLYKTNLNWNRLHKKKQSWALDQILNQSEISSPEVLFSQWILLASVILGYDQKVMNHSTLFFVCIRKKKWSWIFNHSVYTLVLTLSSSRMPSCHFSSPLIDQIPIKATVQSPKHQTT